METEAKACPNCQHEVDAPDNFCRNCGHALRDLGTAKKTMSWYFSPAFVLIMIPILGPFMLPLLWRQPGLHPGLERLDHGHRDRADGLRLHCRVSTVTEAGAAIPGIDGVVTNRSPHDR